MTTLSGASGRPDPRLDLTTPLTPGDAVAALIVIDGHYLLQLRDLAPGIFFPGHWGCFGGGIDGGETGEQALLRELDEELGLRLPSHAIRLFSRFDFDLGFAGLGSIGRTFYEARTDVTDVNQLQLGEGSAMRLFAPATILTGAIPLVPYDAFALWLHINRRRFVP